MTSAAESVPATETAPATPQLELKDDVVNVPPAVMARATRSPKSLLNEACFAAFKQAPIVTTVTVYRTKIELPDGRVVFAEANLHSDSQRKACERALEAITNNK